MRQSVPVTLEQLVELCAKAFDVSPAAIKHGMMRKKVNQARAAAAIIVTSIPHLQLSNEPDASLLRLRGKAPA